MSNYSAFRSATLTGPRGTFRNGEHCARSRFYRFTRELRGSGWRWIAFDAAGRVLHVVEMPDTLETVCDTSHGALWALRACVASYFHDVRSHRGH